VPFNLLPSERKGRKTRKSSENLEPRKKNSATARLGICGFVENQTCAHSNCSQLRDKAGKQGGDSRTISGLEKENLICWSKTQMVDMVETRHCANSYCSKLREKDGEKDEDSRKIWMLILGRFGCFFLNIPKIGLEVKNAHSI